MKVGIIGLGNIAQKAYLPVYAGLRNEVDFILFTRNEQVRKAVSKQYGFQNTAESIEELIHMKIDACFVHAATKAHGAIVKQLLEAGIHVYVDKPLSEDLTEVSALKALAKQKKCLLMVGFNRRFAPLVESLKQMENKNMIFLQKNRIATKEPAPFVVYDLFLHVVDTMVYLLDDKIESIHTSMIETAGELKRATIQVETPTTTAIATMNLFAGANTETYQVMSQSGTTIVENLTKLTALDDQQAVIKTFDDWMPTVEKRGFQQMVICFIQAVKTNDWQQTRQEHIVSSHELCEQLLRTHHQ